MYYSKLLVDVGDNPDRPRPGRLWLWNMYHVHQRLCMAFPSASRKERDPEFLAPYDPEDFPEQRHFADWSKKQLTDLKQGTEKEALALLQHVHSPRRPESGFLFRIDPLMGGGSMILVQSALKPDWGYAFHNADYFLAAPPEIIAYNPTFIKGQRLQFRLLANPTRRLSEKSKEKNGAPVRKDFIGKRVPVPYEKLDEWLVKKGADGGFEIQKDEDGNFILVKQSSYVYFSKPSKKRGDGDNQSPKKNDREGDNREKKGKLFAVRFEGILKVTDPEVFFQTLIAGIGPGKAFGFGLLSVAAASK